MRASGYSVTVVGATGLVGQEIIKVLAERQFPLADLRLYASLRSAGDEVRCGALTARIDLLDGARFEGTDIVFLAAGEQVSAEWVERASESGAIVIDTSPLFTDDADAPVVVPEVNATDAAGYAQRNLLVNPDAPAIALSVVLGPLHAAATVLRVVATTFEPVSGAGQRGIEELQQQTVELMSGRTAEYTVFPQRIAFNVLPQTGELLAGGSSIDEAYTAAALRRLLHAPDLVVSTTRTRASIFHGVGVAVNLETAEKLTAEQAADLLRAAPAVLLQDDAATDTYLTPAGAVGQDAVCVSRIREDTAANVLDLWITLDNLRKGSAVNAVQIAEVLIRDHLC